MSLGGDDLRLLCVIEGGTEAFPIDVEGASWHNPRFVVGDLKKRIQVERKDDSPAHILVLWKVRAIEELRSRIIWLTCHLSSPKRRFLSSWSRNRLCLDVLRLLGNLGKN
jgi:hypothetical protein